MVASSGVAIFRAALIGLVLTPLAAIADGADGVWKTEVNESGGYLEVTIAPCESDASRTCGNISTAVSSTGPDPAYEHLGKLMVWDMKSRDGTSYSGGKIWDPEVDKTYSSKMKLAGDTLSVSGCIAFICSGQDWTRLR